MPYRICKTLEIENGHMLSKHPDKCRFPHGHTRKVELVDFFGLLELNPDEQPPAVHIKTANLELIHRKGGAFQKSDASGSKRGGFETLSEGSPMCVAQLTERGHSCPLPPKCCFTASKILQEWQSDTVYSERPGNADVLVGS